MGGNKIFQEALAEVGDNKEIAQEINPLKIRISTGLRLSYFKNETYQKLLLYSSKKVRLSVT